MRKVVRVLWVPVALALLYLAWTFAERYRTSREYERAMERKTAPPPPPDYGVEVKILHFYASPGVVARGEPAILCYGVANAKSVRIEPELEGVWPSLNRCLNVEPTRDTKYTLAAEGATGKRVTETLVVRVKPR